MPSPTTGRGFTRQLLKLLGAFSESRSTGSLTLRGRRGAKKVFLHDGDVVAVASADAQERLGHYLVGWGFLTEAQLQKVLAEQQSDARGLGELAVARRVLDRDAMCRLLRIRAEDALFDLARWQGGEYRFAPAAHLVRGYLDLRMPVKALLADLERLVAAWRQLGAQVPGPDDVPNVELSSEFQTLSMTEADVLRLVDGKRSLAEVAMSCRISQLEVSLVLHNHARDGLVRFKHRTRPESPASVEWPVLLQEAETCVALADLLEAYDHLGRALATGDTSRELQDRAMKVEAKIRQRVDVSERDVPRVAGADGAGGEGAALADGERRLVDLVDGRTSLREILDRLGGDRLRNLLVAHSLVQCGDLAVTSDAAPA